METEIDYALLIDLIKNNERDKFEDEIREIQRHNDASEQLAIATRLLSIQDDLLPVHLWRLRLAIQVKDLPVADYYLDNYQKHASVGLLRALVIYAEQKGAMDKAIAIVKTLRMNSKSPEDQLLFISIARRFGLRDKAIPEIMNLLASDAVEKTKLGAVAYLDMMCEGSVEDRLNLKKKYLDGFYISTSNRRSAVDIDKGITFYGNEFNSHVVCNFLIPLIREIATSGIPCQIISTNGKEDAVTSVYRSLCDFHRVRTPEETQQFANQTDLLIDCSGFTSTSVLQLQNRISPVQLSYLGHGDITSYAGVDGIILDEYSSRYIQKFTWVHTLPNLYAFWPLRRPPRNSDSIEELCTFGVFSDPAKLGNDFFEILANILEKSAEKVAFLYKDLENEIFRSALLDKLWAFGIQEDQVIFQRKSTDAERPNDFRKTRVLLDGIPFNNGTVTCEALFMGAKIVTLSGESAFERHCGSMLHSVGESRFIAKDRDHYVELALQRAKEDQYPSDYFRQQDLFNVKKFAADLVESFR